MLNIRRLLLGEQDDDKQRTRTKIVNNMPNLSSAVNASATISETTDKSAASSVDGNIGANDKSAISQHPSIPYLPTFDEVEAKLTVLKTNLSQNPLPVDARLRLEQRLAEMGPEISRLKHVKDLKMKDAVAARIYDQLSRSVGWLGESKEEDNERMSAMKKKKDYAVCELTLALDGELLTVSLSDAWHLRY